MLLKSVKRKDKRKRIWQNRINKNNKFCTDFDEIKKTTEETKEEEQHAKSQQKKGKYINYGFGNEHEYDKLNPSFPSLYFELLKNNILHALVHLSLEDNRHI